MKKKKKILQKIMAWTLALLMVLTMSGVSKLTTMQVQAAGTTPELAKPTEGDGKPDTPYEIGTPGELFWFAALVNGTLEDGTAKDKTACAILTADIDLAGYEWIPIGSAYDQVFQGTFDGAYYTVSNMTFSYTDADINSKKVDPCLGL